MSDPVPVQILLASARQRLAEAACTTPALDAEILLAHTLAQARTWLYMYPQAVIEPEQRAAFNGLLQRRARREPVAYLVGAKEFFGLEFEVNRHVLIPRPETELLVETALQILVDDWQKTGDSRQPQLDQSKIHIADVGAGSGCIAIALATRLPGARFLAIDASAEALALARRNARRHNVADRVTFLRGDLLRPLGRPVDLIVSNPPYVSRSELQAVAPEVGQYEPRLALDGGEDGLALIRPLLRQAKEKLKPGGALLVEIGSTQGPAVVQTVRNYFPSAGVSIKQDLAGLDRLLVVRV